MIYTDEQIEQARNTDMLEFFSQRLGLTFKRAGKYYKSEEHDSLCVNRDRKRWYWNSKNLYGGNAVDYLTRVEGRSFAEAVGILLSEYEQMQLEDEPDAEQTSPFFSLPDKSSVDKNVKAYLIKTRKIAEEIVIQLIKDGSIYQDTHNNAVFLGFDEDRQPRYAAQRGTLSSVQFRRECIGSDKRYGFCFGDETSDTVFVFESPIDALSHATIALQHGEDWQSKCRLSLGGTSDVALMQYIRTHLHITKVIVCTDNDEAGNKAADLIISNCQRLGLTVERQLSKGKDFNEDMDDEACF